MQFFIYIVALLEGFTTLSIEIIAIRNFTPIIGTNSISTSIILWVILLALSYGYYKWWQYSGKNTKDKIIQKIISNLILASIYYILLTFTLDSLVLESLLSLTGSYFFAILISCFLLFFIPVYFASQTIPLLSEILKGSHNGEKIGKLLFYSTIWSFLWSVVTSTILFAHIWVDKSATLNSLILATLSFCFALYHYKKLHAKLILSGMTLFICVSIMTTKIIYPQNLIYSHSNSYHDIVIYDTQNNKRVFSQNGGYASGIDKVSKESFFDYINETKQQILSHPDNKKILIIWAAGFTLPHDLSQSDQIERIDVVDVDSDLKGIAEQYFHEEKLSEKITFFPQPSRFFLNNAIQQNTQYDAILIDVYVGKSLAPQTLTYEFFEQIDRLWKNIYLNLITDSTLKSDFSQRVLNTLETAFENIYYKKMPSSAFSHKANFVLSNNSSSGYTQFKSNNDLGIYIDDKNSIELDIFKNNTK